MKRAVITVGLGFGDEGKGATVDFLCRSLGATLVVRYCGGSQAGHNVQLPDGRRHTFSQFGAGTLAGARTYLGSQMIVHPVALAREASALRELGTNPTCLLTVHPRCLLTTYFHQAVNRLKELARGDARHGSCGHGIGEARAYWLRHGQDAPCAGDLADLDVLREKLELQRQRSLLKISEFAERVPAADRLAEGLFDLTSDAVVEVLAESAADLVAISPSLPVCDTAIFEGAQGILLDEWRGFHPHTTWSTVTTQHALELVRQSKAQELCILGITRAYLTRHGAGPLPTADAELDTLLKDPGNPWNPWQGNMRMGWLDLPLLRYAVRVAGAPLDGLVVNCLDHVEGRARLSEQYPEGDLEPASAPSLAWQEQLTERLHKVRPTLRDTDEQGILAALAHLAPVVIEGRGPGHEDRSATALPFRSRKSPDR